MASSSAVTALIPRKAMLVVDPARKVNDMISQFAAEEGWTLNRVSDNQAALSLMQTSPFDLIITGQQTSGREDLDLLRKLRRIRPHVRMIILTDKSTPEDVIESLRENAFSYFRAPLDTAPLGHIVRMAMTERCWDDGIEVISANRHWIRLLARCTPDTADRLVQFLRQADLPEAEKDDVAVAAHEILLNAMEHGAKFDPDQYVEVGYLRTKRAVVCRVKDPGQGFTLEELKHAAINSAPGDLFSHMAVREREGRRPGGFGILLATKLVDEVIYGERGNDVILIKHLDSASAVANSHLGVRLAS